MTAVPASNRRRGGASWRSAGTLHDVVPARFMTCHATPPSKPSIPRAGECGLSSPPPTPRPLPSLFFLREVSITLRKPSPLPAALPLDRPLYTVPCELHRLSAGRGVTSPVALRITGRGSAGRTRACGFRAKRGGPRGIGVLGVLRTRLLARGALSGFPVFYLYKEAFRGDSSGRFEGWGGAPLC